jgi:hypothetical protein
MERFADGQHGISRSNPDAELLFESGLLKENRPRASHTFYPAYCFPLYFFQPGTYIWTEILPETGSYQGPEMQ